MFDAIFEELQVSSPASPLSRFAEIAERFWGEIGAPQSTESLQQFLLQDLDPYRDIADQLMRVNLVEEDFLKFDQFESVQIIARLRRVRGDGYAKSREIAWQILTVNFARGVSDRHRPFFNSQLRALMQDRGETGDLREILLRAVSVRMTSAELMSCRRLCNEAGRRNRARWFDSLIEQRDAANFEGFAPECLRQIREALSSRWCEGDLFASPSVNLKAFPPLISTPIPVVGLKSAFLTQITSVKQNNRVIHYMKNCLNSYRRAVVDGTATILVFEINEEPREVIEVNREKMQVKQWAGKSNAPPDLKTRKAIASMLSQVGVTS